jgi:molecular chaperone DnaK
MSETPAIGIDLGTTNSAIAVAEVDSLDILPNANGDRLTPSVVAFDGTAATVGREAANQAIQYPDHTVFSVKRHMGSKKDIFLGDEGHKSRFTPEELSALILKRLKHDAEAALGRSVERAVITVPAYFNDRERQATKHAGEIAGLEVDRIINEPTAACLAYGLRTGNERTVLVYDLGGGTFDVSLIEIHGGVFEVIATNGETQLGGDDWDAAIVEWLTEQIEREHGVSVADTPASTERLFEAATQAKHALSSRQRTQITLPFFDVGTETVDVEQTLTRDTFEQRTRHLTDETIDICEELFAGMQYRATTVDEVLLVGGATRMPQIQQQVTDHFGQQPSKRINPDEAVALGAAAQAAIITQQALPAPDSTTALTTRDNTDERPTQDASEIILLDVIPQSLGIKAVVDLHTREEAYSIIIPRNTPIPTAETERYSTVDDGQEYVTISVYQGEESLEQAEQLDEFEIGPIPPRPAEEPNIDVEFHFDQDGILHASAEDVDHEIGTSIDIESVFGLTRNEIETMRHNLPTIR